MPNPLADDLDGILDRTRGVWENLRGRRLLITGGTGFVGLWLLESFAWVNDKLALRAKATVLSRHPERLRAIAPHLWSDPNLKFEKGDVRSFDFPRGRFTHVIHAATPASSRLNRTDPLLMLDTIVEGTRRVLEFSRAKKAERFLLVSSGAVYGRQPASLSRIPEDCLQAPDPLDPLSAYGQGKRLAEHLCVLYRRLYAIEAVVARGFAFVGPHLPLDEHFAVGNFIRDGLRDGPIRVEGDGTALRSYLYAADMAAWLWTMLLRGEPSRSYNVGSEEAVSIGELAHEVATVFKTTARIARRPVLGKPCELYVPSVRRVRLELGLRQSLNWREAVRRTIAWHRRGAVGEISFA